MMHNIILFTSKVWKKGDFSRGLRPATMEQIILKKDSEKMMKYE
jgi:hypothetical protein